MDKQNKTKQNYKCLVDHIKYMIEMPLIILNQMCSIIKWVREI